MNSHDFVKQLLASYHPGIRTDAENVDQIRKWLKKKNFSEEDIEMAFDSCRENFRMFPSIADLTSIFIQVRSRRLVNSGDAKAYEYFDLNGYSYRRTLDIDSFGNLIRKDIPEGVDNYQLVVPDSLRKNDRSLNADEAYEQGAISEEFYRSIKTPKKQRSHTEEYRWKKIREELNSEHEQKRALLPEDFIDDSMASNPEEPLGMNWDDI